MFDMFAWKMTETINWLPKQLQIDFLQPKLNIPWNCHSRLEFNFLKSLQSCKWSIFSTSTIPFRKPCFSLAPTTLTEANLSYDLSQRTATCCFLRCCLFLIVCTHVCVTQIDCMIAIAAQLWNQGDPRVLNATLSSLTTNEICASLTVLTGICLAATEPARH